MGWVRCKRGKGDEEGKGTENGKMGRGGWI